MSIEDELFDEEGWDSAPAKDIDNTPVVMAKLVWDIVPHEYVQEMFPEMGLTPSSKEGVAMAHKECHDRINATAPLFPSISAYAALLTEVFATALLRVNLDEVQDDEDRETLAAARAGFCNQNFVVIRAATTSIISHLMDTGLLKLGNE